MCDTTSCISALAAGGREDSTHPRAARRHSRESAQLAGHGAGLSSLNAALLRGLEIMSQESSGPRPVEVLVCEELR